MDTKFWSPAAFLFLLSIIWKFGSLTDLVLFSFLNLIKNQHAVSPILSQHVDPATVINILKLTTLSFTILQIYWYLTGLKSPSDPSDEFPLQPMFFPCQTTHTRIFPNKHSFSYSYLLVGIPVGWKGSTGGMISSDIELDSAPWYRRILSLKPGGAWYIVNGDDYLARGHVEGGLRGKLDDFLLGQGENPSDYPTAYLLTAARFLGYSSNPISIWNLYSASKSITAVILEVNNTFDERHVYLLKPFLSSSSPSASSLSSEAENKERYTHTWPKEFYVSPFNPRAGSYSLSTYDPFAPSLTGTGLLNTTITLVSSEKHPKLIARLFSTSAPLDPNMMSAWEKTVLLAKWWWVGLATFPRTVREAFHLLVRRGLGWVTKPEPIAETLSRHADATELLVEKLFQKCLRHVVEKEGRNVRYVSAWGEEEVMSSPSSQLMCGDVEAELRVLTPSFYSNLVQYECFLRALELENRVTKTISASDTELLRALGHALDLDSPSSKELKMGVIEDLQWKCLKYLRGRSIDLEQKREWDRFSTFEVYILTHCEAEERKEYASRISKLFLASHVALGWLEILDLEIFLLKAVTTWIFVSLLW